MKFRIHYLILPSEIRCLKLKCYPYIITVSASMISGNARSVIRSDGLSYILTYIQLALVPTIMQIKLSSPFDVPLSQSSSLLQENGFRKGQTVLVAYSSTRRPAGAAPGCLSNVASDSFNPGSATNAFSGNSLVP